MLYPSELRGLSRQYIWAFSKAQLPQLTTNRPLVNRLHPRRLCLFKAFQSNG